MPESKTSDLVSIDKIFQKKKKLILGLFLFCIILMIVSIIIGLQFYQVDFKYSFENVQFNNFIDYLSKIFSVLITAMGILGIWLAYITQRHQIEIQLKEIERLRNKDKKQEFETTFFQLLKIHNDYIENLKYDDVFTKRGVFELIKQNFRNNIGSEIYNVERNGEFYYKEHVNELARKLSMAKRFELKNNLLKTTFSGTFELIEPYINNLYYLFSFLSDNISNKDIEVSFYRNIIVNNLSQPELLIIFLYYLYPSHNDNHSIINPKYLQYLLSYQILESIDFTQLDIMEDFFRAFSIEFGMLAVKV